MEKLASLILIVLSVCSSGIASFIVFSYLERRDRRILEKLEELDTEEDYLERMARDDRKLARSTYTVILMSMCLVFLSFTLLTFAFAFNISSNTMKYVYLIAGWMFMVAAGMCFYHFRSIMRISDLDRTRAEFRDRKKWLEKRLR